MNNSSLLKCAAAFIILSVYIWLFGIAGVIEGEEPELVFADESLEFTPSYAYRIENAAGGEELSAGNVAINPINDPKPGLADLPAFTMTEGFSSYTPNPNNNAENEINTTSSLNNTEPPATLTTTSAATTAGTTTTGQAQTSSAPTDTTTATTTATANNSETAITPEFSQRLTVTTSNGNNVTDSALNIISRIVQNEIGSSFDVEAIKAQAVAAYTYVMFHVDQGVNARGIELANVASERVLDATREVLGQALYYDNSYIQAVYHASSAGYTASSVNYWGTDLPYLRSVKTEFDKEHDSNQGTIMTMSATDLKVTVVEKTGIQLTGSPANWLNIIDHVDTVYVGSMTIGGQSTYHNSAGNEVRITGKTFREILGTRVLRSAAFDVSYSATNDRFTFIVDGYGHGVGMSQNGANILARHKGYNYKQILAHYYPGTTLK